jgi:hypothetical protein
MSIPEQLLERFKALSGHRVTLSAMRMEVLAEMASRGFTPDDVETVWHFVDRQVKRGEGGYTAVSRTFGVLIGRDIRDVDKFEDKLNAAREATQRRTGKRPPAALPGATEVTPLTAEQEEHLRNQRRAAMQELQQKIGR